MRIALLHYTSPPIVGGVEIVLAHHARLMTNAGHEVAIFCGRGKELNGNIPVNIISLLDSRHPQILHIKHELDQGLYTPAFDSLSDVIEEALVAGLQGFDILIAHNVLSLHKNLPLTAALHKVNLRSGFPQMIAWHHDLAWTTSRYQHDLHSGYPWDLLRKSWKGLTHVVVSEHRRQELSNLINLSPQEIHVIPNGVDMNDFYKLEEQTRGLVKELKLHEYDPLFLLPARLTPRKNIELAFSIVREVRKQYPQAGLLVTGPEGPHNPTNKAYKEKLINLRNDLELQGAVHLLAEVTTEFLPDPVIADFYRLADALLFPSLEEGFGIPLIEAAFSHIPVFCADIPVLRELGGEDVSYFSSHGNPSVIADQIVERMRKEKTLLWSRRAKHNYNWDMIYTNQIEPLIQEVAP